MGRQDVGSQADGERHRAHMQALLRDLHALERMLADGLFETGTTRIGAEQELVLVDRYWRPAPVAMEVLSRLDDPRVTTELARFNLEFNLDPLVLGGSCFSTLEADLHEVLALITDAAAEERATPLLTGILPTIGLGDLSRDNITPMARYYALDDAIKRLRGGGYELRIKGADELVVKHDSVMLEALNTSFQIHFQVEADEFARKYNLAQAIAAPMLAICANSPILFGKRLWRETRIAIFQQAVDTRAERPAGRDTLARVRFGEGWVQDSVLEVFRSDIARFKPLVAAEAPEDPIEALDRGEIPKLKALQTHNSTVYRWNRPCYGITDGKPHLRIECRLLGAGPSIVDEVANAALWVGLMAGGEAAFGDVASRMDFSDAAANFTAAAREGVASQLDWLDGETLPADVLVYEKLVPVARDGLIASGVPEAEADHYLEIICERAETKATGSHWMLQSVAAMKGQGTRAQRLQCLASATYRRQTEGEPAHTWPVATLGECESCSSMYSRVDQYMTTDLFTVDENESIDLVASIMDWEKIRHVPVEDNEHRLVGLVSYRKLLKLVSTRSPDDLKPIAVSEIMTRDPVTAAPTTSTLEAISLMKERKVSALPVTDDGRLVGIVTEHDFMRIAERLLEIELRRHEGEA